MIDKTMLISALVGALLLVSILSGNASAVDYTLVVLPPLSDDGGGGTSVIIANKTIPEIPSNSHETVDTIAATGLNFTLNTGTSGTVGAVSVNIIASTDASELNAVEVTTASYGIAQNQKSLGRYIEVNVAGDIANISSYKLEIHYTDADLDANDNGIIGDSGDINPQSLEIYRYHNDTDMWKPLVPGHPYYIDSGLNTTNRYLWVEVNHLSTFGLVGTVSSSRDSRGGSGVGDAIVTSESSTTMEKAETSVRSLIPNTPAIYTYKTPELGIYEIVVTGEENENDILLRVEVLKDTSKLVTISAPGMVYKNINIWAGTKQIKEVLIRFRVENSWITDNNFAGSDVKIVRWDDSKWVQLETLVKSKDDAYTFYEAKTDTLSVFSITGLKGEVVPIATQVIEITETPAEPIATPKTKGMPGLELIMAITMILVVYILRRQDRD